MSKKQGTVIAIDGGDFSGKSTLINNLLEDDFSKKYNLLFSREPGNLLNGKNRIACEAIRKALLNVEYSAKEQAILFGLNRKLHVEDMIRYAKEGYNIIVDRFFFSSLAYQAYAGELGYNEVLKYNKEALQLLAENNIDFYTLVLELSQEEYEKRLCSRKSIGYKLDVIEKQGVDFHDKVRAFFNGNEKYHLHNFKVIPIDANKSEQKVLAQVKEKIENILK